MARPGYKRPGKAFTVFAVLMIAFLVLGTIVVFGGAVFGGGGSDDPDVDEGREETSRLETQVAENPNDAAAAGILASIYASAGRLSEAIRLYERALVQRPDDSNLRLSFGIALLRNGNWLDAEVQLERARELAPDTVAPEYYLGELEQSRDEPDLDAAREWYEAVIEQSPDSRLAEQARDRLAELDASDATASPAQ